MSTPKISVIIPVYKVEKYLHKCIESVLSQTYTDFELLLIDDGSPDNSGAICDEYAETDIRIRVYHKQNGGVSSARNYGLDHAMGEWIIFLDGDDMFLPNALSCFIEAAMHYDGKVIIANFEIIEENGNIRLCCHEKKKRVFTAPLKAFWLRVFYSRPGNTMIHKNVFQLIKGYDESLSYNEDYEFTLRILNLFTVIYIPNIVMKYFKVASGASMYLHPFEKDFVSRIGSYSQNSIWIKFLLYSIWEYSKKTHKCNKDLIKIEAMGEYFSKSTKIKYYLALVYRKIKSFLI